MAPQPAPRKQRRSTGPRTESGKATCSRNALRHGLASSTLLIPGEDPAELARLEQALLDQYSPATPTEELLVTDMVKHHWLKDRALRLQGEALAAAQPGELPASFSVLLRYQNSNERAFHKALGTLLAIQKEARAQADQSVSQDQLKDLMGRLLAPMPEPRSLVELRKKYMREDPS